jgi:hypothetical protein
MLMTQHQAGILVPRGALLPRGQAVTVRFNFLDIHPHRLKALTPTLHVISPGPQPAEGIAARLPLWLSAAPPPQDLEVLFSPQDDHSRWESLPLESFVVVPGSTPSCHVDLPGWGRLVIMAAAADGSEGGGSSSSSSSSSSERSDSPEPSPPESPGSGGDGSGGGGGGESGSPSSRTRSWDEAMRGEGRERLVYLQAYGPPVWEFKPEGERPYDLLYVVVGWNEAAIRDKAKKLMSNRTPLKPLQYYGEAQASWAPGQTLWLTLPAYCDAQFEVLPGRPNAQVLFPSLQEKWVRSVTFALRPARLVTSGPVELLLRVIHSDQGAREWSLPEDQRVTIMPAYHMGGAFVRQGGPIGSGGFGEAFVVKSSLNDGHFLMKCYHDRHDGLLTMQRELTLFHVRREWFPRLYEVSVDHGMPCLIMELLEGKNLLKVLQDLPPGERVGVSTGLMWLEELSKALSFLQTLNILHCDVKLENIIIRPDNKPRLIDFGICERMPQSGRLELDGRPHMFCNEDYRMAPEQRLADPWVDRGSEVWHLGCVFAQVFSGTIIEGTHRDEEGAPPLSRQDWGDVMDGALPEPPSEGVRNILNQMFHEESGQRPTFSMLWDQSARQRGILALAALSLA